ncbi:putative ATPase [Microbacterium resistens]|uniref:ATPase n=1 Tax=Microbacterium resistens TaxID=156977 RepID=A0ABU1SEM9_9MICO|nr:AAA family ATPase [Microbacterium resistens]MDR6868039.1 putative ATPase [Microbacterium resistens]
MRIVVSGTHASGKSTLISDFSLTQRGFAVLPDPFDEIETEDPAGVASFLAQLRVAAARLRDSPPGTDVIAERGPLDFLAYLRAVDELGRSSSAAALAAAEEERAVAAMRHVDLLIALPLTGDIVVDDEEDPALRTAMDQALLELLDDRHLCGGATVIEVTGNTSSRLASLEDAVRDLTEQETREG